MSISPPRQHENGLLEDEIRWAPHTVPSLMFGDWLGPSCLMWIHFMICLTIVLALFGLASTARTRSHGRSNSDGRVSDPHGDWRIEQK